MQQKTRTEETAAKDTRTEEQRALVDEFIKRGPAERITNWKPLNFIELEPKQQAICHELVRLGDLSFLLHPGQKKLFDWKSSTFLSHDYAVINAARQSGKSFGEIVYDFNFALNNPLTGIWYGAPTKEQVKEITATSVDKILSFFPDDMRPRKAGTTWTFKNGTRFLLVGTEVGNGEKLRGMASHRATLDECRNMRDIPRLIDEIIFPMFNTTNGKLTLISTPPNSPQHEFTSKYINEAIRDGNFYHATYRDNPLMTKTDEELERQYPGLYENPRFRREYLADWTIADDDSRVVRAWNQDENDEWFRNYWEQRPKRSFPYVGIDPGGNDNTGIVFANWYPDIGVLVAVDEFSKPKLGTQDIATIINEKETKLGWREPGVPAPTRVCDHDIRLAIDLGRQFGLMVEPVHKQGMSKIGMVNNLSMNFELGKIRVHPSCYNLKACLSTGLWHKDGKQFAHIGALGHLDALDALLYINLNMKWFQTFEATHQMPNGNVLINPFARDNNANSGYTNISQAIRGR